MDLVRPPQGLRASLGQPEKADFSRADQVAHGAHGFLDGRIPVHPVLVVKIDDVGLQAAQAGVAAGLDVLGSSVDPAHQRIIRARDAELGRQHDLVAPARQRLAHQFLIGEGAVHVRGVDKIDALVYGAMDSGDGLAVVALAVELRHPHTPEPESGYLQLSQSSSLHGSNHSRPRRTTGRSLPPSDHSLSCSY